MPRVDWLSMHHAHSQFREHYDQLAQRMLTTSQFCVTRSEADDIAKQVSGVDGVIGYLCSEGALFDRIDSNNSEIIEFSYERLTDTFLQTNFWRPYSRDSILLKLRRKH